MLPVPPKGGPPLSAHPAVTLLACCQSLDRSPEGTAQFPLLMLGVSAAWACPFLRRAEILLCSFISDINDNKHILNSQEGTGH